MIKTDEKAYIMAMTGLKKFKRKGFEVEVRNLKYHKNTVSMEIFACKNGKMVSFNNPLIIQNPPLKRETNKRLGISEYNPKEVLKEIIFDLIKNK